MNVSDKTSPIKFSPKNLVMPFYQWDILVQKNFKNAEFYWVKSIC